MQKLYRTLKVFFILALYSLKVSKISISINAQWKDKWSLTQRGTHRAFEVFRKGLMIWSAIFYSFYWIESSSLYFNPAVMLIFHYSVSAENRRSWKIAEVFYSLWYFYRFSHSVGRPGVNSYRVQCLTQTLLNLAINKWVRRSGLNRVNCESVLDIRAPGLEFFALGLNSGRAFSRVCPRGRPA